MFGWRRRRRLSRSSGDSKSSRERKRAKHRRGINGGSSAGSSSVGGSAPDIDLSEHKPERPLRPEQVWSPEMSQDAKALDNESSRSLPRTTSQGTLQTNRSSMQSSNSDVSSKRSVRFSTDSKTHDGVSRRNALLDKILKMYFVNSSSVSDVDVLRVCEHDLAKVCELRDGLMILGERLKNKACAGDAIQPSKSLIPALPAGGGWGTKLSSYHLPYVATLLGVVDTARTRLTQDDEQM